MRKLPLMFEVDGNGCFNVTSHHIKNDGYVYLYRNGKHQRAHRLIYQECFGEIRTGLVVRHKCDNRKCINPEHLELGTPKENTMDCVNRGRLNSPKGEKNGRSVLSESVVREVRRLVDSGMKTKDIAVQLSINFYTVKRVRERKTWKNVQ